ncbi:MAG: VWA domain-containing protein [Chthonomonadales bacterium]
MHLTPWQRWLFGAGGTSEATLERAHLYFAGGHARTAVALVLAAAVLWFGYQYLRDGNRPSLWVKIPLLMLRLIAVAALLAMLLQPMLRLDRSEPVRTAVAVGVDVSQSMGLRDPRLPPPLAQATARAIGGSAAGLTRAEIVERLADNPRTRLIATLARRYRVYLYRFASDAQSVPLPTESRKLAEYRLPATPDAVHGGSTQIGVALRHMMNDLAGQDVAGILLLSDGGSNLGEDPVTVAAECRQQGIPVSTLGIGDPTPTRDVALTEALTDEVVRKDNIVQVFAGISQRGYAGRTVTVTLQRGNTVIGRQTLRLAADARKQTVRFTYTPKQVGTFTYTVSVSPLPGEVTLRNNSRRFLQKVVSKRLRILYVEGEPRWEYRYLKNAIRRDTQILFSCILVSADARLGGEGNVPIYAFPSDEKSLFAYDLLILGDVPRAYFTDAQLHNIRRFVEDRGGSLVVIAGERHMPYEYKSTSLEALFPVVLGPFPEQVKTDEPFQWERTPAGMQDPLLRLSDSPAENERIWRDLPGMYWCAGVERAKPGATVLAVNPLRSNAFGKRIVLAVQPFGAGRCLMSTVDSTWRWRWRVGDKYFYRFWGQVIRTMSPEETPGGNRFVQVSVDRPEHLLGDTITFHARVLDAFYHPVKASAVAAQVSGADGAPRRVMLSAIPSSPGLFAGQMLADRAGKFQITLASPQDPRSAAKAEFLVEAPALEQQQPEMNETLLKKIAAAGGGRFYRPDELASWMASLKAREHVVRSQVEIDLWNAPIFLMLFVVPLALEWAARKRIGMA